MGQRNNGTLPLSDKDKEQMSWLGISEEQLLSQIERFEKGAPYLKLDRPATISDGIRSIPEDEGRELISVFEQQGRNKGPTKFVPASGAASRMFKILHNLNNNYDEIKRDQIAGKAEQGDPESLEAIKFIDGIGEFAFFDSLRSAMDRIGVDAAERIKRGDFKDIIDCLLTEKGLDYARLPKGLLIFHRYKHEKRTAFEEQLVEASDYARDEKEICRLHFTVSPEHRQKFEGLLNSVKPSYEKRYGVRYSVDFSVQANSTNTVAVDPYNNLFRLNDGSLLFRPGGHGALLENLNSIERPVIFIKNIDNVVPDRLKGETYFWKKVLGGYLLRVQEKIFSYIEELRKSAVGQGFLEEVEEFARKELCLVPPSDYERYAAEEKQRYLEQKLNRPLRICGMVRNVGEPGGGPFWVKEKDGSQTLQIVEKVQVDPDSEEQQALLRSSTHFNPVDIVCGVTDWQGRKFDLRQYVNQEAVFISKKSKDGRDLKALELPGLWNGAMAYWNTVFVEVPLITFNPVKTVTDLLREEHKGDV